MNIRRALEKKRKEIQFSANQLKIIAMISMFIDHMALTLILNGKLYGYDEVLLNNALTLDGAKSWLFLYRICRIIGRMAYPIFVFLLFEGYRHTSNITKYILRVGLLAFISEVPYDLMVYNKVFCYEGQNVVFVYFISLIMLILINVLNRYSEVFEIVVAIIFGAISWFLKIAYGIETIMLIYIFYKFRNDEHLMMILTAIILFASSLQKFYGTAVFAIFFIYFYNEKRGELNLKTISYLFYPLHMIVLYSIVYFSYLK